jgi:hypothetical protein
MKENLPKPIKAEASVCPRCGFTDENEGHVKLCIRNHIPPTHLRVRGAVGRDGSGRLYSTGDRWPTVIEVWCDESQTVVLYRRIPDGQKPRFEGGGKPSPVVG